MSPLTDIQDNIEKLRSLQESLHDLCTFISTLDLTSGAKEETLIHGITELKEAFANVDLSSVEQAITDVKNAVTNIDFSALAEQSTLLTESQVIQEAIQNIDLSSVESKVEEVGNKIDNIKLPEIDTTELAKESTLSQGVTVMTDKLDKILNTSQKFTWEQF